MSVVLLALLLLPLIGSIFTFFWKNNKFSNDVALGFSLISMLLAFYALAYFNFDARIDLPMQYEINLPFSQIIDSRLHFGIDGLSMIMVILTNILVPLIILSSFNEKRCYSNKFYGLILLMQFGLLGVFTSLDGLVFYGFWEITLIPIWFICGLWGQEDQKLKFTTKFFIFTFVGSLFMLAGLIFVYDHSNSFALVDLYNANLSPTEEIFVFWFIFAAFAVKFPIFPFHNWQADTYTYSPTQGSMLLSGIMAKMAVFGLLRYLLPITPHAIAGTSGGIVLMLCVFTVVFGGLVALIQNDSKRIIAYSSLSHIGLIAAGIFASALLTLKGNFTIEGGEGAIIQAFAHGINVVGLFYCADILFKKFKTRDIRQMGGLASVAPKFAVLFMVILFGSLGVPLTNGFIGEFILIKSVYDYNSILGILSGLTMILAAGYLLRFYGKTMFGEGDKVILSSVKDISGVEFTVLASLAIFVILLGIFPQPLLDMANSSLKLIYGSLVF
ncbi:MAG: NADH-quinone oxidoreductase subunit M [Chryseobacterium sp.]|nr:NADH-quinone oxidoreductase subunit M [Chryseobacterium sp.]